MLRLSQEIAGRVALRACVTSALRVFVATIFLAAPFRTSPVSGKSTEGAMKIHVTVINATNATILVAADVNDKEWLRTNIENAPGASPA